MKSGLGIGILAIIFSVGANADIIPVLTGITGSGTYTWNYRADLTSSESLDPAATNGNSCSNLPCNPPGTFFTIYDFAGYVAGSVTTPNANWTPIVQNTGLTPQQLLPTDSAGVPNLTFLYTGPVIAGPMSFTGFSAISTYNSMTTGMFATQATKLLGPEAGSTDRNLGNISVPSAVTPEPGYFALLLPVFAFMIHRRRTRGV